MDQEELPERILVHRVGNGAHGVWACVCGGSGIRVRLPRISSSRWVAGPEGLRKGMLGRGKGSRLHPQSAGPQAAASLYLPQPSWL